VPHQQRQLALAVLRQEVLHVHLLDHVLAVGIELGGRPAGLAHDRPHRLAADLGHAAADMERAHAAQHDVLFGGECRRRGEASDHCDEADRDRDTMHAFLPDRSGIRARLSRITMARAMAARRTTR
jgi:hypothetical protein